MNRAKPGSAPKGWRHEKRSTCTCATSWPHAGAPPAAIHPTSSTACSRSTPDKVTWTTTEIVDQLVTLFIGGTETLPKVLAGGAYQLWRNPEQRAGIVADPSLVGAAFEEMLRYELPLQFVGRTLLTDGEVAGVQMRAGQRVVLMLISANRDEREFAEPDRFDAARRMDRHLGLGHGVHICIGAHVARLEGVVMIQELLARFPRYDVDETQLVREASEFQVGWTTMPITGKRVRA